MVIDPSAADNCDVADPATQNDSLLTQPKTKPPTVVHTMEDYNVSLLSGMTVANKYTTYVLHNILY